MDYHLLEINILDLDLINAEEFLIQDRILKLGDYIISKLVRKNMGFTQTIILHFIIL